MEMKVKVTIKKTPDGYLISNDRGKVWEFLSPFPTIDTSFAYGSGSLAVSLLTATCGHIFYEADLRDSNIEFELKCNLVKR